VNTDVVSLQVSRRRQTKHAKPPVGYPWLYRFIADAAAQTPQPLIEKSPTPPLPILVITMRRCQAQTKVLCELPAGRQIGNPESKRENFMLPVISFG
jgi:hypothetical protein